MMVHILPSANQDPTDLDTSITEVNSTDTYLVAS